jgi:hypothetical protein
MNGQLAKRTITMDDHTSIFVEFITSITSKVLVIWTTLINFFSKAFKTSRKQVESFHQKTSTNKNDFFEEDAFYSLFEDKDLFKETYGHEDNPLVK